MHYLERLIRRALALPRDQAQGVFDPFEHVAPWDVETSARSEAAPVAAAPAPQSADAAATQSTVTPLVPERLPAQPSVAARIVPTPVSNEVHAALPPSTPATPHATAPSVSVSARPAPIAAPALARADAFMRSLGVQQPAMQAPPARFDAQHAEARPVPRVHAAEAHEPAPPQRRAPALLRPAPPPALPAAIAATASARGRPVPSALPRDASAPSPRHAAAPPAERIVQTTVVLAPPSRRLDELAHSSGIARFGIGQS